MDSVSYANIKTGPPKRMNSPGLCGNTLSAIVEAANRTKKTSMRVDTTRLQIFADINLPSNIENELQAKVAQPLRMQGV
jgi:hypothetical protein